MDEVPPKGNETLRGLGDGMRKCFRVEEDESLTQLVSLLDEIHLPRTKK